MFAYKVAPYFILSLAYLCVIKSKNFLNDSPSYYLHFITSFFRDFIFATDNEDSGETVLACALSNELALFEPRREKTCPFPTK